jgi:hypothetical protein
MSQFCDVIRRTRHVATEGMKGMPVSNGEIDLFRN